MRIPVSRGSFPLDFSLLSFVIIDDQPFARRLVRSILLGFGSREVYESANGAEAIELTRTVLPSIVVTDLIMPTFNGLCFIRTMREPQSPANSIPIIVLSGYLTRAAALMVKESGADEVLVKPLSPKALYEHISRIVLRQYKARQSLAFLKNQNELAAQRKKSGELALV